MKMFRDMRTLPIKIILYLVAFLGGLGAVSLLSFWLLVFPTPIVGSLTPEGFNMSSREISLETEDGFVLRAWLIEPEGEAKAAVIILHGYPAERSDMLFIARGLYPDFTLLLPNMRSFGGSEGVTTFGLKERLDVRAAVDLLVAEGYERIGVFGFSVGGAAALLATAEDKRIDAVASYGTHAELAQLAREQYRYLPGINYLLVEFFALWGNIFLDASLKENRPAKAVERIAVPVFITHSREDTLINFSHAQRLEDALMNNKQAEFYFFDEPYHGVLPLDFNERLKNFFESSL